MGANDFYVGQLIYSRNEINSNQCWFECSCDSETSCDCDYECDYCQCDRECSCDNDCGCDDPRYACWKD